MGIKLVKAKDNSAHFSRGELYKVAPYKLCMEKQNILFILRMGGI